MTTTQSLSRWELNGLIADQAEASADYRDMVLNSPRRAVAMKLGRDEEEIPGHLQFKTLVEDANTRYVVLPEQPQSGEELSDEYLASKSTGKDDAKARDVFCTDNKIYGVAGMATQNTVKVTVGAGS